jgi:nicotinate-nucleotide pyrophosphorylase (carboxylating)
VISRIFGRFACIPLLLDVFKTDADVVLAKADADRATPGDTLATLTADYARLLALERTLLNLLSRLSGVATYTRRFVDAVADTPAQIFDTRKTTPGLRALEKYAVRCAGAYTHRLGLYDAVLIKDNHLAHIPLEDLTRRLGEACSKAWSKRIDPGLSFVEVEVDSLEQLDEVLAENVELVLLDNFPIWQTQIAVQRRDNRAPETKLESSGGLSLDTAAEYAGTGVDYLAVGALTHSVRVLDIGLDL